MDSSVLNLVQEYREQMADGITRPVARLYSHYAQLRQEQDGLVSWTEDEAKERLNDAVELVEAAFIEQALNGDTDEDWESSMQCMWCMLHLTHRTGLALPIGMRRGVSSKHEELRQLGRLGTN